MNNDRRLAGVVITGEDVAEIAREGKRSINVVCSSVPASALFFTSHFDHSRNAFVVIFEDESFGLIPPGGVIPLLPWPHFVTEL